MNQTRMQRSVSQARGGTAALGKHLIHFIGGIPTVLCYEQISPQIEALDQLGWVPAAAASAAGARTRASVRARTQSVISWSGDREALGVHPQGA